MSSQPQKRKYYYQEDENHVLIVIIQIHHHGVAALQGNLFYFTNITTDSALEFVRQEI